VGYSISLIGEFLGDSWRAVNSAARLHLETGHSVGIFPMLKKKGKLISQRSLLELVISQLDLPYVPEIIGEGREPGIPFSSGKFLNVPTHGDRRYFPINYFSTKQRPAQPFSNVFSYQLYGQSNRRMQSFSRPYAIKMIQHLQALGYRERLVGRPLSLAQSIDVMCNSRFHIGIDSGMTHVARSIGLPTYVYTAQLNLDWIGSWHPLNALRLFRTIEELETLLRRDRFLPQL
jgi:hypothetical protein